MIQPLKTYDPTIIPKLLLTIVFLAAAAVCSYCAWQSYATSDWPGLVLQCAGAIGFALVVVELVKRLRWCLRYGTIFSSLAILLVMAPDSGVAQDQRIPEAAARCFAKQFLDAWSMPNVADIESVTANGDMLDVRFRRRPQVGLPGIVTAPAEDFSARIRLATVAASSPCECLQESGLRIVVTGFDIKRPVR